MLHGRHRAIQEAVQDQGTRVEALGTQRLLNIYIIIKGRAENIVTD